jgi:hypothetical protein
MAKSVMVLPTAKLICIFTKFKMAANATGVKVLNVLKNTVLIILMLVTCRVPRKRVLNWVITTVPNIQKGQSICDKHRKVLQPCIKVLEIKGNMNSYKLSRLILFLP